mgnify:CR=1 FL=1
MHISCKGTPFPYTLMPLYTVIALSWTAFGQNVQAEERGDCLNDMKTEILRVRMTPEEKAALNNFHNPYGMFHHSINFIQFAEQFFTWFHIIVLVILFCNLIDQMENILCGSEHLSGADGKVNDVSFHVGAGEIVGIAGLVGAGKSELCKTIFGAYKKTGGVVTLWLAVGSQPFTNGYFLLIPT